MVVVVGYNWRAKIVRLRQTRRKETPFYDPPASITHPLSAAQALVIREKVSERASSYMYALEGVIATK